MEKNYKVKTSKGDFEIIKAITPLHAVREYVESKDLLTNAYRDESDIIEVKDCGFYCATYKPYTDSFEVETIKEY